MTIGDGGSGNGPVIVLSYAHSGSGKVQDALAAGTGLACTSGTGILPLCASAAETWRRVEARDGRAMSRLAAVTIRSLVAAQVTAILAGAGKARWCELSTAPPGTAEPFLQLFPAARFVCVHRSCLDVIRAGVRVSPWGLPGQGMIPHLLSYPGNNVAALVSYWASAAEQLLAFEEAHHDPSHRVRYEDVISDPDGALAAVKAALQLEISPQEDAFLDPPAEDRPQTSPDEPEMQVPVEMIPEPLRERIARLHAQLGYPSAPGLNPPPAWQ
jgi:Sulfotransferase family